MTHHLGVELKIARARLHFKEVDEAAKSFLKANPYHIAREYDTNAGENVFRVVEEPVALPPELGVIVGDMVYNFRSALDILANRLVEANGGKPTRTTAFPIFETIPGWNSRHGNKVTGMSPAKIAIIKSEQPCFAKNPNRGRFLWYLEDVCNGDKHRNVTLTAVGAMGGMVYPPFAVSSEKVFFHNGAIEKDTVVCRVPGPDVDMYLGYFPDIAFGQGGPAAGVLLSEFYYTIDFVVPDIVAELFGGARP